MCYHQSFKVCILCTVYIHHSEFLFISVKASFGSCWGLLEHILVTGQNAKCFHPTNSMKAVRNSLFVIALLMKHCIHVFIVLLCSCQRPLVYLLVWVSFTRLDNILVLTAFVCSPLGYFFSHGVLILTSDIVYSIRHRNSAHG